jgi:hypothetical protein
MFNVYSCVFKNESWMITPATRWKWFAVNARNVMSLGMIGVVYHRVYSGMRYRIARFELVADFGHSKLPIIAGPLYL